MYVWEINYISYSSWLNLRQSFISKPLRQSNTIEWLLGYSIQCTVSLVWFHSESTLRVARGSLRHICVVRSGLQSVCATAGPEGARHNTGRWPLGASSQVHYNQPLVSFASHFTDSYQVLTGADPHVEQQQQKQGNPVLWYSKYFDRSNILFLKVSMSIMLHSCSKVVRRCLSAAVSIRHLSV